MKKALIIIVVIIGILLSLQIRSFKTVDSFIQRSKPSDVLAELRRFQLANEQLNVDLAEKEKELVQANTKISSEAMEDQINKLRILSGEETIFGEGVEITIGKSIQEYWFSDLVATVISDSAEAVAFNDIRLTPKTAGFRDFGNGLVMGNNFLSPPIRVSIIGPKKDLYQSLMQNGGIVDRIQNTHPGLNITVTRKDKVIIPARELTAS